MTQTGGLVIIYAWLIFAGLLPPGLPAAAP